MKTDPAWRLLGDRSACNLCRADCDVRRPTTCTAGDYTTISRFTSLPLDGGGGGVIERAPTHCMAFVRDRQDGRTDGQRTMERRRMRHAVQYIRASTRAVTAMRNQLSVTSVRTAITLIRTVTCDLTERTACVKFVHALSLS